MTAWSTFCRVCLGMLLLAAPCCRAAGPSLAPPAGPNAEDKVIRDAAMDPIGTATMLDDGTILLQLRAEGPGGVLGDALLRYAPTDPRYGTVRDHLPKLRPGATVNVPPFQ